LYYVFYQKFFIYVSSLESILNQLYTDSINIIICGDININYLDNTNNKIQLYSLLASYDLYTTVGFPTRINNCSHTVIDNIFIHKSKNTNFTINPLPNGLLDHDAQIMILHNIKTKNLKVHHYNKGLINEFTIPEFKLNLIYESWEENFTEDIVDSIFNSFVGTPTCHSISNSNPVSTQSSLSLFPILLSLQIPVSAHNSKPSAVSHHST